MSARSPVHCANDEHAEIAAVEASGGSSEDEYVGDESTERDDPGSDGGRPKQFGGRSEACEARARDSEE